MMYYNYNNNKNNFTIITFIRGINLLYDNMYL